MRAENQQFRKHTLHPFQPYFILKNKRGMKLMPITRTLIYICTIILKPLQLKLHNECAKPEKQRIEHEHYG